MSVTVTMQDYMAGWDLARELLLDLGLSIISKLLNTIVPKSADDEITMGVRECLRTAQLMGEVPMASIQLFC